MRLKKSAGENMLPKKLLVANRGEIALRVIRTAREMGIPTVALHTAGEAGALWTTAADAAVQLPGAGAAAFLDGAALVQIAVQEGCDAVHPGYGFLSENAGFARACADAGLVFVGPGPDLLDLFGDKVRARQRAAAAGVPVPPGRPLTSADDARKFMEEEAGGAPVMLKAVAGGGGRGIRRVLRVEDLAAAWERCASEARAAFGCGDLYAELYVERARHVEVQILGDGRGGVQHLGERDCSIQRRNQKLLEIAPAPGLPEELRERLLHAALTLAEDVQYGNIGTVEFLVNVGDGLHDGSPFWFLEVNPRLQVEHTVTEEVMGVDLVALQLRLAGGASLPRLPGEPRGMAVQARINGEILQEDGTFLPASGRLSTAGIPGGAGIRVDSALRSGMQVGTGFDSLLAKVIACHPDAAWPPAAARLDRALEELELPGVQTNQALLRSLLQHPRLVDGDFFTGFLEENRDDLVSRALTLQAAAAGPAAEAGQNDHVGAKVSDDPLAVLDYGKEAGARPAAAQVPEALAEGRAQVTAPMQGTVVSLQVQTGDRVGRGAVLLIMESMKMEHEIKATTGGVIESILVQAGDTLREGARMLVLEEDDQIGADDGPQEQGDPDEIRPDLAEVLERRRRTLDEARPKAVERRRKTGQRTARENILDLCDPDTFVEYGSLVLAAQRRRRSLEDLIEKSPADGMITGVGAVNSHLFDDPARRCAVLSYDYTVFAGTQGAQNHRKTDRMIDVATKGRLPVILFAEGGGGRPGDTDGLGGGFDTPTFARFATLSGLVPMVGIASGRCFAGNASLVGCCDVVIATANTNLGMGGPAMIEGGGLGVFAPEDIGPMAVQRPNGVVDIAVEDEAEAVQVAKKYLSYFQGPVTEYSAHDQRELRRLVPENRLRIYDIRAVIRQMADVDSVLEIRRDFGPGMITALIRVGGRPMGLVANNPAHLGGAIDADGADKAARFMQLCDAFDLPLLFLCDTPGIMVGPETEKTAIVRHSSRMFITGANLSVPFFTIVLRKSYGLGALAMAGGSFRSPWFSVSWPTGEFGGMGLEGAVKLGFRRELEAIKDPEKRRRTYDQMVASAYEAGKALNYASFFSMDDTIDPAESRFWLESMLQSVPPPAPRDGKKRSFIDAW